MQYTEIDTREKKVRVLFLIVIEVLFRHRASVERGRIFSLSAIRLADLSSMSRVAHRQAIVFAFRSALWSAARKMARCIVLV